MLDKNEIKAHFENERLKMVKRHSKEMYDLQVEFAHEMTPFNIGDIVEDHIGIARLTERTEIYSVLEGVYYYMFNAEVLTKKLEPTKAKEKTRTVHGGNITKKHG